ncbi:MAG: protein kinase domain-containing protein [Sporichthyaceae bacterium]
MTVPPPESALPALGGRYRLVERIARGGMGEVWRAFDEVLSRPVAVKVLRPEYADEHVFLERFRNEARNTAALVHTGIAGVYDFGQASLARTVVPFMVMELVPGQPLSQIVDRDGALDIDRALDLCAQAGRALHAAHLGGVVHRDVKPANLLVTPNWIVKITDFGIARAGDAVPLTKTGTVMGTAHYLAPELVNGRGVASAASDTYALGVVLYECLAGRRPFVGDNPLAVAMEHLNSPIPPIDGLHPAVAQVLETVLAKDPMARPPSAEAFAHRLLALRIELAAGPPTPETVAEAIGDQADPAVLRKVATRSLRGGRGTGHRRHAPRDPRAIVLPADPETTEPDLEQVLEEPVRAGRHRAPAVEPSPRRGHRAAPPKAHPLALQPRRAAVFAGVGLVVVAGIGALWLQSDDPDVALVPAVSGVPEYEATGTLKGMGFDEVTVVREIDDEVPAGVVLTQTPKAGTRAATDTAVSIVVSSGRGAVEVANVDWIGKPYAQVRRGLEERGLRVRQRQVLVGGAPGTVTDVSPRGRVPAGEEVTVSVVAPAGGVLAKAATAAASSRAGHDGVPMGRDQR